MTKRDYENLAQALKMSKPDASTDELYCIVARERQWQRDIEVLATNLAFDNPRFDASKFNQACGVDAE